jgi:FkbM family methyltransferase
MRWFVIRSLRTLGFNLPEAVFKSTPFEEPAFFRDTIGSFAGTYVDIGAAEGYYVSLAANAKSILAFEPDQRFWDKLERIKRTRNCVIYHDVVSDRAGRVTFNISLRPYGSRLGDRVFGKTMTQVERNSITLDSIQLDDGPVLVKLDTEGAEHLILKGGQAFIRKYRPILLMEYHWNLPQVLNEISLAGYTISDKLDWGSYGWLKAEPKILIKS